MVTTVATADAIERASRIRLVLTDCDGVLTDGGVYYSARGEELKRFSMRDGMGVERLRTLIGVRVGILTKETSPIVASRAAKLGIDDLFGGVTDKLRAAQALVHHHGIALSDVAFIGDDVNDIELLHAVGFSACPADAEPAVLEVVNMVCARSGGHGAFRELAEVILASQAGKVPRRRPAIASAVPSAPSGLVGSIGLASSHAARPEGATALAAPATTATYQED